ncbi:MAG: hypothetical protein ABI871_03285 [Chthoniobacterales bacterium]
MERDLLRYDDPYGRTRRKTNVFGWSIAILLLTGFAFAAWLGSFYIFGQPERPQSYEILKKLHKVEPAKRFELTAAPAGEFLNAKQLYDRYTAMRPTELANKNAELARNYIRNFQGVRGLVPYVVGRFVIMGARELSPADVFTSGMVALTLAVDQGELLMEHVYPADTRAVPLMKQTLGMGLELKLERSHDLSAVIHADRLPDGRILITAIPLLYGSYTVSRGTGTFALEPPFLLNLAGGWPLFKETTRRTAQTHFDSYRERVAPVGSTVPIEGFAPGLAPSGANALIRVQPALPVEGPKVAAAPPVTPAPPQKNTPVRGDVKTAQSQKGVPSASSVTTPPHGQIASAQKAASPAGPRLPAATPSPSPSAQTVTALPAQPVPGEALASTAGGGNWKTYPPGRMPVGRLIATTDLPDVADRGLAGERVYLSGQFIVNFVEANRAVLRPKTHLTESVLHPGTGGNSTRIIVEFPSGYRPPARGTTIVRDEARPYEITEVRKQADGQLNVFVREIME